jgi:dipeptide/tripeptide permease
MKGLLGVVALFFPPPPRRTTGIALLLTAAGIGKLFSSLLFGWLSVEMGNQAAIVCVLIALAVAILVAWRLLKGVHE